MFKNWLNNPLYVQVGVNRMTVRQAADGESVTLIADMPFSHPRMLIGDFTVAERLLKQAFKQLRRSGVFYPSPAVVMHPLERIEGGMTMIEERVLRELALGSGARSAVIWVGNPLTDAEVLQKLEKK